MQNLMEYLEELLRELAPEDHHVSVESTNLFLDNDRVWPVEVWLALPDGGGTVRLSLLQLRPDATRPQPGRNPLERHWTTMTLTTMTEAHRTIRECPEETIRRCAVETDAEKLLAIFWETDHHKPRGFLTGGERR